MGSTPGYIAVLLAFIGPISALAGVWLTAARTDKRSVRERDERRFERAKEAQEDRFAKFLSSAHKLPSSLSSPDPVLESLRDTAARIELKESVLAENQVQAVLDAADRLLAVRRRNDAGARVVTEADAEYRAAVVVVRQAMKDHLDQD
ncbi:hypothetical protein [Saccharopolyspora sp. 5N708]|uniref:hypothetical protein n=1 Tax=Saccharopolyspora sp. 5N708 TaxID=3457424 RepID=UPI003FD4604D